MIHNGAYLTHNVIVKSEWYSIEYMKPRLQDNVGSLSSTERGVIKNIARQSGGSGGGLLSRTAVTSHLNEQ